MDHPPLQRPSPEDINPSLVTVLRNGESVNLRWAAMTEEGIRKAFRASFTALDLLIELRLAMTSYEAHELDLASNQYYATMLNNSLRSSVFDVEKPETENQTVAQSEKWVVPPTVALTVLANMLVVEKGPYGEEVYLQDPYLNEYFIQ